MMKNSVTQKGKPGKVYDNKYDGRGQSGTYLDSMVCIVGPAER